MMVQRREEDGVRKARERSRETCEQTLLGLERERTFKLLPVDFPVSDH